MIKGSQELSISARIALNTEMHRCIELGRQPSFKELYIRGYTEGFVDTKEYLIYKAKEWLQDEICFGKYIEGVKNADEFLEKFEEWMRRDR